MTHAFALIGAWYGFLAGLVMVFMMGAPEEWLVGASAIFAAVMAVAGWALTLVLE